MVITELGTQRTLLLVQWLFLQAERGGGGIPSTRLVSRPIGPSRSAPQPRDGGTILPEFASTTGVLVLLPGHVSCPGPPGDTSGGRHAAVPFALGLRLPACSLCLRLSLPECSFACAWPTARGADGGLARVPGQCSLEDSEPQVKRCDQGPSQGPPAPEAAVTGGCVSASSSPRGQHPGRALGTATCPLTRRHPAFPSGQ